MKFSGYKIFTQLTATAMMAGCLAGLWGCADDNFDGLRVPTEYDADTQLVINLAIPRGEMVNEVTTRAITESGTDAPAITDPTQAANVNELQINSLRLFLFPGTSMDAAPTINRPLFIPSASDLENGGKSAPYEVSGLTPGSDYKMYIVANVGSDMESIATRQALEDYIVDYTQKAHNLVAGNLPMVYESSSNIVAPESDANGPLELSVAMQFACVKLRYSIIFDRTEGGFSAENFGESKLKPTSVTFGNVTAKSHIICDRSTDFYESDANTVQGATGTNASLYSGYTLSADGGSKGEDVVNGTGSMGTGSVATLAEAAKADKWLMQGTLYVPERYVSDKEQNTTLNFTANLASSTGADTGIECKYASVIGEKSEDYKCLNRGYYYEFIGKVVNVGADMMVAECKVHDWVEEAMPVDFIHTYLNISSTEVNVTSLENGELRYDTDGRGEIGFECEQTYAVGGKELPLIELSPKRDADKVLELRYNAAIPLDYLGNKTSGSTKCWITAGNIRKSFTVTYNFEPFLTIEPTSMKIMGEATTANEYIFTYRTNLGGVSITSDTDSGFGTLSSANLSKSCTNTVSASKATLTFMSGSTATEGRIIVTGNPDATTVVHLLTANTIDSYNGSKLSENLSIEMMTERQYYRVYFRSINDYCRGTGDTHFLDYSNYTLPKEGTAENWKDYWNSDNYNQNAPHERHSLYAYTQYGENPKFDDVTTMTVWEYSYGMKENLGSAQSATFNYGGTMGSKNPILTADQSNMGWYYYDLPFKCTPNTLRPEKLPADQKDALIEKYGEGPLPGATMLIFTNCDGYGTRHRVNAEKAPGIPLGDDSDHETWVLYDPTRAPVYNVYADKPVIEDVTYEIYSDTEMTKWETQNMYGNVGDGAYFQRITSGLPAGYSYGYKLQFKAPRGEYDKAVKVRFKTSVPQYTQYVYFNTYYNGDWNNDQPYIIFAKADGSDPQEIALDWHRDGDGVKQWRMKVPEGYNNGKVRFKSHNGNSYYPSDKWLDITPNLNYIAYSNGNGNIYSENTNFGDMNIDQKYQSNPSYEIAVDLFYGANWTKGYYKNGEWSPTPNP